MIGKSFKGIFRIGAVLIVCAYLLGFALNSMPPVQKWMARTVANELANHLQTRISVGSIEWGLPNRLIVNDLKLYDRSDSLMLDVYRVAAKVEPLALLRNKIRIRNAQLIGANAYLYQKQENTDANYQFVLDAFKSNDDSPTQIPDLRIGTLILRRCALYYNKEYLPVNKKKFDVNHLGLSQISLSAELNCLTEDSLNVHIRKLSLDEQSGLSLKNLKFRLEAGGDAFMVSNMEINLPHSNISAPLLSATNTTTPWNTGKMDWFRTASYQGALNAEVRPADVAALVPSLSHFEDKISLSALLSGRESQPEIKNLRIQDKAAHLRFLGNVGLNLRNEKFSSDIKINTLSAKGDWQQFLMQNIKGEAREINAMLTRAGDINAEGNVRIQGKSIQTDLKTNTSIGRVALQGKVDEKKHFDANLNVEHLLAGELLTGESAHQLQNVSLHAHLKGTLPIDKQGLSVHAEGNVSELVFKGYNHRNMHFLADLHEKEIAAHIAHTDSNGQILINAAANWENDTKRVLCNAEVKEFCPQQMNLIGKFPGERFSGSIDADLNILNINHINGDLALTDLVISSDSAGVYNIGDIHLSSAADADGQHLQMTSPYVNLNMDGDFRWKDLMPHLMQMAHEQLPSVIKAPANVPAYEQDMAFKVEVQDTTFFTRILGKRLSIPEKSVISGHINTADSVLEANVDIPKLYYNKEEIHSLSSHIGCTSNSLHTSLLAKRMMKGVPMDINFRTQASKNRIQTNLNWDNGLEKKRLAGGIDITGAIHESLYGSQALTAMINPSYIVINDTTWQITPANVTLHNGIVDVENVKMSQGERHLAINGRVSKENTDTLQVELQDINLSYIFDIINFHSVEFAGNATGTIYAYNLTENPTADAFLRVGQFTFNEGRMGDMDIHLNWGKKEINGEVAGRITLDADIHDESERHRTFVRGTITPGKKATSGLDLNVNTQRINLHFINKYAEDVIGHITGRASGKCRIYGPFKKIDLDGDLVLDEASVNVDVLGVRYKLMGDSVSVTPGVFHLKNATVYDPLGSKGATEHAGKVNGKMMHEHFKNMKYDFQIEANNLLSYNFNDFGDLSFYGTVYANGQARIQGKPGSLNIDVNATPLSGSTLVYDASSPQGITEAEFITYVDRSKDSLALKNEGKTDIAKSAEQEEESSSDMYMNMHINVTPDATLNLLMDNKSGDNITLHGNGTILTNYYNKGKFQMYGTYRVEDGTYDLSLQEFIHKNFVFQPDGTIVFGGDAYQADLSLKAIYTVPNVSLDDLSATSLGLSNTRVDCVMNIGGKAKAPIVTFDFDLPNANDDEKQMVKSMVSTEEERNMQVIYLLGIGRFYSYGSQYAGNSANQSEMAVNSLVSSTLSSQFNRILSNAIGASNWSLGTNLRTGETGWDELDIEGILSGRMFNNRLLINGNFGYRENYYSTNNFIGDFDVKYLITPGGGLALKAYNQTNDRYFIQSSLTTQGIGIQFKRDFNNWKEAFRRKDRQNTKKKKKDNNK